MSRSLSQALYDAQRDSQERVVEYRIHTHASYATCETADRLRIAGTYTPKLSADKEAQART
jgi:hypothetical protein